MLLALLTLAFLHTESDVVAVPAEAASTVTLRPTHGCGESPTVRVSTRVPIAGATAGAVEGWTATVGDDGDGNTIIEWTGGTLPADVPGAFPVAFTAPDAVGELLLFPFVQTCADGQELPWISGDPASEFPAPRLLVLPAGSAPAETIDDVPADAPGRDQLTAIVDVDNPVEEPTTTSTSPPSTETTEQSTTTVVPAEDDDDGDSSGTIRVVGGIALIVAALAAAVVLARRRARTG